MSLLPERKYSFKQRWRDGPISCFSWPSSEVQEIVMITDPVGQDVAHEEKLPSWRERIRKGLNATTKFQATESSLIYTPGHLFLGKWCGASNRFGWYQYDGDLLNGHTAAWDQPVAPPTTIHNKTRDEAIYRAIKDARSRQTHFRGGNFVAELGDTIRGLRNPAKGFRDLLDAYRRNARRRVKRAVGRRSIPTTQQQFRELERASPDVSRAAQRALSDTWLEHNFGWQPLLSDAVDAYKALRALSARVPLAEFRGHSENSDPPSYLSNTRTHDVSTIRFTVRTVMKYDCTVYGAVKVETDAPPWRQGVEEMGVRARDFLPAVWEAIPYSFLVDYFTNIGDIIEAVSFPRSDLAWISLTYRNHSMRSIERMVIDPDIPGPAYPASNSNKVFSFRPSRVEWDRKYVDRSVFSGSFVHRVRFEIPGPKNWRKYFNIAALARLRTL